MDNFQTAMNEMNVPYTGFVEKNRSILSALGTYKTSCLVPSTMEAAPQDTDESIHIITFKGLKDFYPGYIISRRKNTRFSVYDAGVSSTMSIASRFEEKDFFEKFLLWLEKLKYSERQRSPSPPFSVWNRRLKLSTLSRS